MKTLVLVRDTSEGAPFSNAAHVVVVCVDHETARELRASGATNVRIVTDYLPASETFDRFFSHVAPLVRSKLLRDAGSDSRLRRLAEIVLPDAVREGAAGYFLQKALTRAVAEEGATHVALAAGASPTAEMLEAWSARP